jgi:hypothetical protein
MAQSHDGPPRLVHSVERSFQGDFPGAQLRRAKDAAWGGSGECAQPCGFGDDKEIYATERAVVKELAGYSSGLITPFGKMILVAKR